MQHRLLLFKGRIMEYAKSFKELEIYKIARRLNLEVYEITKSFPKEEIYSLTDQLRRCCRSIGAQIAEAWAKKKYEKHFISKLTDADGELQESEHWIDVALECGYLSKDKHQKLLLLCDELGRMLNSTLNKSHSFCKY
jgi:four helix bundle protein